MSQRFYNDHASTLAEQYHSTSFSAVHQAWLNVLEHVLITAGCAPSFGCCLLDLGAGAGRDAKYLAELSTNEHPVQVYAIEPAQALAAIGKTHTASLQCEHPLPVIWLDDALPTLGLTQALAIKFDLILLSAVWMHIEPSDRSDALANLASLLKAQGKLIISLRHGDSPDERVMHPVSLDELTRLGEPLGLHLLQSSALEQDQLGRNQVQWQTVVLTMEGIKA
ncbi:class I SAM-dependent methyltransferase [Shewanella sp. SNU WT4]|uniref:class I SAM-dependent methyltransferase n=1 Tax=Shewanella sp. SNU WT4 TaxID=2590015 RepID=UPI00112AE08C|nr:class I SAM-dependent methyltransferase [Shewanella sp. SNU WT4]QDF66475.1 class I SAM-dependent methyltransferase [Shewanella sp. SNU WT4]